MARVLVMIVGVVFNCKVAVQFIDQLTELAHMDKLHTGGLLAPRTPSSADTPMSRRVPPFGAWRHTTKTMCGAVPLPPGAAAVAPG